MGRRSNRLTQIKINEYLNNKLKAQNPTLPRRHCYSTGPGQAGDGATGRRDTTDGETRGTADGEKGKNKG